VGVYITRKLTLVFHRVIYASFVCKGYVEASQVVYCTAYFCNWTICTLVGIGLVQWNVWFEIAGVNSSVLYVKREIFLRSTDIIAYKGTRGIQSSRYDLKYLPAT